MHFILTLNKRVDVIDLIWNKLLNKYLMFTTETLHFKGRDVCQNYQMEVACPELQWIT